ncbi:alpha/beta hydrolase [Methyloraptor flagellatus]|jgi:dienelactone hydrolase|uniref:Alpha/beta fold hydrolase n=1 Tax=Methyloraptor flagellatus TaxID=3162530 RepID=A0AAU7XFN6_9HYPH
MSPKSLPLIASKPVPAIVAAVLLVASTAVARTESSRQVILPAADGVAVSATLSSAEVGAGNSGGGRPIVVLFHQAGGSGAEYDAIVPHLLKSGFETLAVDQRSGGSGFGRANRTAERLGRPASFLEALPDLKAAVAWAEARAAGRPVVIWGSSYSASLVFLVAAADPKVAGVVSFSPGEYFGRSAPVAEAAAHVSQPIFVSSASDRGEVAAARAILAAAPAKDKVQVVPKNAGHGSIALAGSGGADVWPALDRFLARFR